MAGEKPSENGEEPVSCADVSRMRAQVGDATLRRYAQAYLDLLPERLDRIDRATSADQVADAKRAAVDLRISSEMLGARRLAAKLIELESSLHRGLIPGIVQLAGVRTEAALVVARIRMAMECVRRDRLE
jgi:HPt (histidine-containing phosphotransfer) domain-containing protein